MRLTDPRHVAFWAEARLDTHRLKDCGPFDDNPEGAAFCVRAILTGTKTATSALAATARDYAIGDLEIVTEFDGTPRAVIEITGTDLILFGAVDHAFAKAEGDGTVAAWRETHLRYYGNLLKARSEILTEDTQLRRIFFKRVYPT